MQIVRDPILEQARSLRDALRDIAKGLGERDAKTCGECVEMMENLGTEVDRLRDGIGCFRIGQLERDTLFNMARTWNKPFKPLGARNVQK